MMVVDTLMEKYTNCIDFKGKDRRIRLERKAGGRP